MSRSGSTRLHAPASTHSQTHIVRRRSSFKRSRTPGRGHRRARMRACLESRSRAPFATRWAGLARVRGTRYLTSSSVPAVRRTPSSSWRSRTASGPLPATPVDRATRQANPRHHLRPIDAIVHRSRDFILVKVRRHEWAVPEQPPVACHGGRRRRGRFRTRGRHCARQTPRSHFRRGLASVAA